MVALAELSLTGKRWELPAEQHIGPQQSLASHFMALRGIRDAEEALGTYTDGERAVKRIQEAIAHGETVGIFGDYDCDGITATAQLVRALRRHGTEPVVTLPHRVKDGYGLSHDIVSHLAKKKVTLLLTVDTGISSIDEIAAAKAAGIDTIVTDHHQPREELPQAFAILHPALEANIPEPHPAGAGVAYALVYALEKGDWEGKNEDTVLAMIGTIADLVPLRGMNRTLVQDGLHALRHLTDCPLALLRDTTESVTATDIAFRIAPRLNAAGRMDDPTLALAALLNGGEALLELDKLNTLRQDHMHTLTKHATESIEHPEQELLLWAASPSYPHGIIGLIAGKLTEQYGKPSCAVHMENTICTASLRSPACYHITEGLKRCSDLLISFGGHAQAAGCSFEERNAGELYRRLSADIAATVAPNRLRPSLTIDAEVSLDHVTLRLIDSLSVLEPYGQGNPEPVFLLRNVLPDSTRVVGKHMDHLQFRLNGIKGIGFGLGHLEHFCSEPLDMACRLGIDTWNGARQPQVVVVDIRKSETVNQ